jgi:putative FmdB family regulatory protein
MPIYEYTCRDCGKQFEELVRSDSQPECPACHGQHLEKMLSAFAVSSDSGADTGEPTCGACGKAPGSCMVN